MYIRLFLQRGLIMRRGTKNISPWLPRRTDVDTYGKQKDILFNLQQVHCNES